nr:transposase [Bradyrhizobium elkanii]
MKAHEPGAVVTDVARRHGCQPQQVHDWRRRARLGPVGAAGFGGHAVVRAGGVGIGATGGRRAHRVAGTGSSRCDWGTSGGARDAWPCCVE